MGIEVRVAGDNEALIKELARLSQVKLSGVMRNISEGMRTSTMNRFRSETTPDGTKWADLKSGSGQGGKILTKSTVLKQSIRSTSTSTYASVGTNDIRAATHQYGAEGRVITARKAKYLTFKMGNHFVRVKKVTINIPARPFLGISDDDIVDIRDEIKAAIRGR